MEEIWKPIVGYEQHYEVSNLGRVKSKAVFIPHTGNWTEEGYIKKIKIKNLHINRYGYLHVKLCKYGQCKHHLVHRLVGMAFLPEPNKKLQINHIDGNKLNNCVTNLEWATSKENMAHAWQTGLINADHMQGSRHPKAKITEDDVVVIRNLYQSKLATKQELSDKYGLSVASISDILYKRTWKNVK